MEDALEKAVFDMTFENPGVDHGKVRSTLDSPARSCQSSIASLSRSGEVREGRIREVHSKGRNKDFALQAHLMNPYYYPVATLNFPF